MPAAQNQDLTIFSITDDAVPLAGYGTVDGSGNVTVATFSTDPAHARPYLKHVEDIGESIVDFLEGGSVIGQMTIEVVDYPRTPGDQDSGLVTYLLPDANGETQLLGVRMVFREQKEDGTWEVVFDGVCGPVRMPKLSTFQLQLRDARERERNLKLFNKATDTALWPAVGPKEGLGFTTEYAVGPNNRRVRIDNPVFPRVKGVKCVFAIEETLADGSLVGRLSPGLLADPGQWDMFITDDAYEALLTDFGQSIAIGLTNAEPIQRWENVLVEWSATGAAGTYKTVGPMFVAGSGNANVGTRGKATNVFWIGKEVTAFGRTGRAVFQLRLNITAAEVAAGKSPGHGNSVFVRVVSNVAPTPEVPLYIEEEGGTMLKKCYDGDYTKAATVIPVRYDTARMDELIKETEVLTARIEGAVEDGRKWIQENIYLPLRLAPSIRNGKVYPLKYEIPDAAASLTQLDNSNTIAADWVHGPENIINQVSIEYQREIMPVTRIAFAKPVVQKVILERNRLEADSQRRHGTKAKVFKPVTLRSLITGGTEFARRPTKEVAALIFAKLSEELLRRFTNGAQIVASRHGRTVAINALQEGDWVIMAVTWLPDYVTRRRGMNRLMQVIKVRRSAPHVREFLLLDAGPHDQPIAQPTLGTITENVDGSITIPVTAMPAGAGSRAEVQYALGETQPETNSGEWYSVGWRDTVGDLRSPPELWPGRLFWYRARGTKDGRRASAWTNPLNHRLTSVALIRTATLRIEQDSTSANYGKPVVLWENLPNCAGIRIAYERHAKGTDAPAALTQTADFDATAEQGVLPITLNQWEQVTVQVRAYPGWTGAAVSGAVGGTSEFKTAQRRERSMVVPSGQENETYTSTTGDLVLAVTDPQKRVTLVEFRTKAGTGGAFTGWATDASVPYGTSVTLVQNDTSFIQWRVSGYDNEGAVVEFASGEAQFPSSKLVLRIERVSESVTQVVLRVKPISAHVTGTATITYDAAGLSISPASSQAVSVTKDFGTTGYVDFTVTRSATDQRAVAFTVSGAGFIQASQSVDITPSRAVLQVSATNDATNYYITWTGTNVEVKIDGGAYAAPAASPITVTRPDYGSVAKVYAFRSVVDGQTVSDNVIVQPKSLASLTLSVSQGFWDDAANELEVTWSHSGMPTGTIFNVSYMQNGSDGTSGNADNVTSVYTFTGVTGATGTGWVRVDAIYDGQVIASKTRGGTWLT